VEPMRLELAPTPLVLGALRLVGGARARLARTKKKGKAATASASSADASLALCGVTASGRPAAPPPDALQAWTGPLAATVYLARGWVESGRLDMLASRNFAAGAGAAHLALWGCASLARPPAGGGRAAARARWLVPALWGRRGKGGDPPSAPASPAAASAVPRPGRIEMTMAILTDSLGLDAAEGVGVGGGGGGGGKGGGGAHPTPAARVAVRGSADSPDIAWVAAARDVLAALVEAHATPAGSAAAAWLARRRAGREAAAGPPPPPVGDLPWESRLQRAGASRRAAGAGAPPPPATPARLGRAVGTRLGLGARTVAAKGHGTAGLRGLRGPKKWGGGAAAQQAAAKPAAWSRDAYVAPAAAQKAG